MKQIIYSNVGNKVVIDLPLRLQCDHKPSGGDEVCQRNGVSTNIGADIDDQVAGLNQSGYRFNFLFAPFSVKIQRSTYVQIISIEEEISVSCTFQYSVAVGKNI